MVLKDVSMKVKPGEIHALLGENGAGKSTLMNILFGMPVIHASGGFAGEMLIDGVSAAIASPHDAMEKGIGMVHQEFMLIPGFTITENIKLNREITRSTPLSRIFGESLEWMDNEAMRRDARKALSDVGMSIEEYTLVKGLPVGYMQFVEIAREIDKKGIKLLVFDEPTAVLAESEAKQLMDVMKTIAQSGIAIIFITHRLDEVMATADVITVLRDGKLVATKNVGETNLIELASLMIGRAGDSVVELPPRATPLTDEVALKVSGLAVDMPGEKTKDISFDVREGEIFGIGGLAGQGKIGIPNGIVGTFPASGEVELFGEALPLNDVSGVLRKGVAMLSEDRRGVGLLLDQSIEDNAAFSAMQVNGRFLRRMLPKLKKNFLNKAALAALWALCAALLMAGYFGITQFQSVYDTSVWTKQYIAYQSTVTVAASDEADILDEGVDATDDDISLPDDSAASAAEEEEIEETQAAFLSERSLAALTQSERARLFFAQNAWRFIGSGFLLAAALFAYWAMTKGSITLKDAAEIREFSRRMIEDLDIRCTGSGQLVGTLSGGNQQKVCIARALALSPRFLFVSEPTRGIDIGAKRIVLETLIRLNREQKLTIVMVSSELLELRSICDRIAIVTDGAVAGVFNPDAPDADIGLAMSGITPHKEAII